jgi:N-hydroxyarylamine O-acetyltransferase
MINLEHYLRKINISPKSCAFLPSTEQIKCLEAIYFAHLKAFPYENFELRAIAKQHLLKRNALNFFSYDKLLTANRGGYCYQSAMLLYDALTQIGFTVKRCEARVLNGAPINDPAILKLPATHMCLVVAILEQEFLLDPGLGASAPRLPILVNDSQEIINQYPDQLRLYKKDDLFVLEKKTNEWKTLIQTTLKETDQKQLQYNLLKLERHPNILPIRDEKTLIGLITEDGRKSLLWNNDLKEFEYVIQRGELYKKEIISDYKEAYQKLVEEFKITYISAEALQQYCADLAPPQILRRWEINLPIEETELTSLEKNLSCVQ